MGKKLKKDSNRYIYSFIYGNGIYELTGLMTENPMGGDMGLRSPVLRNVISGETYFVKRADLPYKKRKEFEKRILSPTHSKNILWPCDMVDLYDMDIGCDLFVDHKYTDIQTPVDQRKGSVGLLFPSNGYPNLEFGERHIFSIEHLSWKNPQVRKIAYELVRAFEIINREGYVYADMNFSRFYFDEYERVYLDFSNLIVSMKDMMSPDAVDLCAVDIDNAEYPIEFAEPALYNKDFEYIDFNTQNYSLAAMLFYLFTGRYAYDGRLMSGYLDTSIMNHYVKFKNYMKLTKFVFDPEDTENEPAGFLGVEEVIALWEEMP